LNQSSICAVESIGAAFGSSPVWLRARYQQVKR
jgi:hypothetical protein